MKSLIRRQEHGHLDRFWDLFGGLPRETARYVPRFLATIAIIRDPRGVRHGAPGALPGARRRDGHREPTPSPRRSRSRARAGQETRFSALNPELRRGTTPGESYALRVPTAVAGSFETKVAALPVYSPPPEVTYARHRIRRGDTLSTIARRYRTTVGAIMRENHLRSAHRIRVGPAPSRSHGEAARRRPSPPSGSDGSSLTHTVRRGDSLWKLASRYGSTVDRIKRDNALSGNDLSIGQKLVIRAGSTTGARRYTVRRGGHDRSDRAGPEGLDRTAPAQERPLAVEHHLSRSGDPPPQLGGGAERATSPDSWPRLSRSRRRGRSRYGESDSRTGLRLHGALDRARRSHESSRPSRPPSERHSRSRAKIGLGSARVEAPEPSLSFADLAPRR